MKVLIAAAIYPPDAGGPAIHAKHQFEKWPRLGVETELVALAHYRHLPFGIRHFAYFLALRKKAKYCDVVYAHDAAGAGLPALLAARAAGKKCVVRVGGDVAWERQAEGGALSMMEWYGQGAHLKSRLFKASRFVLSRANKIIVPAHLLKEVYTRYYAIPADHIEVIPNPFPEPERGEDVGSLKTMIFASRLVAYKNLAFVIRSLKDIFAQYEDLKLVVMGDGPEQHLLEELSRSLALTQRVEFRGRVAQEEVLRETSRAWCIIAPALTEFNPNYLLQGIAFGKPFLVSQENGLAFSVPPELTFDPRETQEFQSKILALLTEPGYIHAKQFVGSLPFKNSWEDNLRANAALLEALLNGSK